MKKTFFYLISVCLFLSSSVAFAHNGCAYIMYFDGIFNDLSETIITKEPSGLSQVICVFEPRFGSKNKTIFKTDIKGKIDPDRETSLPWVETPDKIVCLTEKKYPESIIGLRCNFVVK